jgi:uncharacterized protein (DUF305 family)
MRATKLATGILFAMIFMSDGELAGAQSLLPSPVKTCQDVHAYVSADNSMTMETFKKLLTAAGKNLNNGGNTALDMQCQAVPHVKQAVIMSQRVLTKDDGGEVRAITRVTLDNGICKLVDLSISGC